MLDAHCNYFYWAALVRRYAAADRAARVFLAATSSSAVASWALLIQVDILWKALSSLSALIALALPVINLQSTVEKTTSLTVKWFRQMRDYEALWAKADSPAEEYPALSLSLDELSSREVEWKRDEAGLPDDRKLLSVCQDRVLAARGLPRPEAPQ